MEELLRDLEAMAKGEGAHANHRQELAGRCLYCSCGSRAQLTRSAMTKARERLRDSPGISTRFQVVLDPGTPQEFVSLTTSNEEKADASVARHLDEGTPAEKRLL